MRVLFTLIFLGIFYSTSLAQVWCTPGSQWSYHTAHNLIYAATVTQTYLYDTIVNNTSFNKIHAVLKAENGEVRFAHLYTARKNNVIYMNSNNVTLPLAVDTFIYFGPIGSKWRCHPNAFPNNPVGYQSCSNSIIEITDTGHVNYQGQSLEFRKVNYTNYYAYGLPGEIVQTGIDTIFDRVGYKQICYLYSHCYYVTTAISFQHLFNCFRDDDISMSDTSVCNYYVGLKEWDDKKNSLTIYPNPASNQFSLDLKNAVSGPVTITIIDLFGHELRQWKETAITDNMTFSTFGLAKGIYVVQVVQNVYRFSNKLIIEDR